jgi:hypothetical protein
MSKRAWDEMRSSPRNEFRPVAADATHARAAFILVVPGEWKMLRVRSLL